MRKIVDMCMRAGRAVWNIRLRWLVLLLHTSALSSLLGVETLYYFLSSLSSVRAKYTLENIDYFRKILAELSYLRRSLADRPT